MGYATTARGVNVQESSKHEVMDAFCEWVSRRIEHWSDRFFSDAHARSTVGRLWNCDDRLPFPIQVLASRKFHRAIETYGHLARQMLSDLKLQRENEK